MVVKTETCSFTGYRIYPGHGLRTVSKDGTVTTFISAKAVSMFRQRIKPVKLGWTTAWRRFNKKDMVEGKSKRKNRRAGKVVKAIVGMSTEELAAKKRQRDEIRATTKVEAEKLAKEKAAKRAEKKKAAASAPKAAAASKVVSKPSKGKKGH